MYKTFMRSIFNWKSQRIESKDITAILRTALKNVQCNLPGTWWNIMLQSDRPPQCLEKVLFCLQNILRTWPLFNEWSCHRLVPPPSLVWISWMFGCLDSNWPPQDHPCLSLQSSLITEEGSFNRKTISSQNCLVTSHFILNKWEEPMPLLTFPYQSAHFIYPPPNMRCTRLLKGPLCLYCSSHYHIASWTGVTFAHTPQDIHQCQRHFWCNDSG